MLTCADATSGSASTRVVTAAVSSRTSGVPCGIVGGRADLRRGQRVRRRAPSTVRTPNTDENATSQVEHDREHHDAPRRPAPARGGAGVRGRGGVVAAASGRTSAVVRHAASPAGRGRAHASRIVVAEQVDVADAHRHDEVAGPGDARRRARATAS